MRRALIINKAIEYKQGALFAQILLTYIILILILQLSSVRASVRTYVKVTGIYNPSKKLTFFAHLSFDVTEPVDWNSWQRHQPNIKVSRCERVMSQS